MATYLVLNAIFLAGVICGLVFFKKFRWNRSMMKTLIILLAATAVFDSLIVAADIVNYDASKILGVKIGMAPIEDFLYAVLAALLIPALWETTKKEDPRG